MDRECSPEAGKAPDAFRDGDRWRLGGLHRLGGATGGHEASLRDVVDAAAEREGGMTENLSSVLKPRRVGPGLVSGRGLVVRLHAASGSVRPGGQKRPSGFAGDPIMLERGLALGAERGGDVEWAG